MYEFCLPGRVVFGEGALDRVVEEIKAVRRSVPANLILVTMDEAWVEEPVNRLKNQLAEAGCDALVVFNQIRPNPTKDSLVPGIHLCREREAEGLIALGGGSALDAAKIIAQEAEVDILVTIPTTAGSGGEISPWAVITDGDEKLSLIGKAPDVAVLDPELTATMPPRETLFTGIDAFSHALEAYTSKGGNGITEALSFRAMELIDRNFPLVLQDGRNLAARAGMLEGSLLAGMAMLNGGLGLIHAIANTVGGKYHDLPHGWIILHLLKEACRFSRSAAPVKFDSLADLTDRIELISIAMARRLNIPWVTIREEDIPLLAEKSARNVNVLTNSRPCDPADIEAVIRSSFAIV